LPLGVPRTQLERPISDSQAIWRNDLRNETSNQDLDLAVSFECQSECTEFPFHGSVQDSSRSLTQIPEPKERQIDYLKRILLLRHVLRLFTCFTLGCTRFHPIQPYSWRLTKSCRRHALSASPGIAIISRKSTTSFILSLSPLMYICILFHSSKQPRFQRVGPHFAQAA
jgi:hypothetical protein